MIANQAREITRKVMHEQLKEIFSRIENAAKNGINKINFDTLTLEQLEYLKALGYRISKGEISW